MRTKIFILLFFLLYGMGLTAQDRGMRAVEVPVDGKPTALYHGSYALIIGVSEYSNGWSQLPGVKEEVKTVKTALEKNGFKVEVVMDPNKSELDKAFTDFISKNGQVVDNRLLFYFAGHGYTVKTNYGEELGYIVPVDAPNPNYDLARFQSQAMEMAQIEIYARRLQAKHAIFLFDACFSGSLFTSTRAVPAIINYKTTLPVRQFITSGSAEEMVPDKSVFGEQFVRAIDGEADGDKDGYVTGSELGDFLQSSVVNYSNNSQHPQYGKIRSPNLDKGDFVFPVDGKGSSTGGATHASSEMADKQTSASQSVKTSGQAVSTPVNNRVETPVVSTSPTTKSSKKKEKEKTKTTEPPPPVTIASETLSDTPVPVNDDFIPVVYVEGGTFNMGEKFSAPPSPGGFPRPTAPRLGPTAMSMEHPVTLKSFYIGKYEITQKQWRTITGSNPSAFQNCDDCPVEQVSWEEVQSFLHALNLKTGKKYRLPTEAEWEFAAQGGNITMNWPYAGGKDVNSLGWYGTNAKKTTHPVGQKQPNELGLFDMSGNVLEWCSDWFNPKYYKVSPASDPTGPLQGELRVARGGSWMNKSGALKVAFRRGVKPNASYSDVGFRIVRDE